LAGSKLNKRKANALSRADREKVEPIVKDLNAIMDDIDQRIAALARECPSEWSDNQRNIDAKISRQSE
jgi:hypothetical protein